MASDPRKEGLPCFGVYGGGSPNQEFSYRVYNSKFELISSPFGAFCETTTSYRAGILADAMYSYSASDIGSHPFDNHLTSQGYGSSSQWTMSIHQVDQYPGATNYSSSILGDISFNSPLANAYHIKNSIGYLVMNQVLPEGCRPRRIFSVSEEANANFSLFEYQSSNNRMIIGIYDYSSHMLAGFTTNTFTNSCGYNEKTKTLVISASGNHTTSNNRTFHVFKSSKDLNSVKNIKEYFDNLTSTEAFSGSITNNSNKDEVIIVGNNGFVGVSTMYTSNNRLQYQVFDCNVKGVGVDITLASRQHGSTHQYGGSMTTAYGGEQGPQYYTKFNTTWDNTWGAIYSSYYYYGSGINSYIVNLENPKKFITYGHAVSGGSGGSGLFIPMGRTGFAHFLSSNTDTSGITINAFCLDPTDSDETTTTMVSEGSTSMSSTGNYTPTYVTNGNHKTVSNKTTSIHGGYYSTCYPGITTINWWGSYGVGANSYTGD